jgi:6-phosphogluconolactonase
LGTDRVVVYELDAMNGKLTPRPHSDAQLPPGSGPRHLAFGAQGQFAYLMNELSATITSFAYEPSNGALRQIQMVDTLPEGFGGLRSGAEIAVRPDGRFLYSTTRSHGSSGEPPIRGLDSLVWFAIDPNSGKLEWRGRVPTGGEIPRAFIFDATGTRILVAHQRSGNIVTFQVDPESGTPAMTGEVIYNPVPVCMAMLTMPDA